MERVARMMGSMVVVGSLGGCAWSERQVPPTPAATVSPAAAADPQATAAAALAESILRFVQVDGWFEEDSTRFVAFFDDGELRQLIERIDGPTESATVSQYYFDGTRLFYFDQHRRNVSDEGPHAANTRLSFDANGTLLRAERSIDGAPALVTDDEVLAVRLRVEVLRIAAQDARRRQ